jgi:hypothetical protein
MLCWPCAVLLVVANKWSLYCNSILVRVVRVWTLCLMPNPSSTKDFMLREWGRLWDFFEGVSCSYDGHDVITMTFLNSSLNIVSCTHVPVENNKILCKYLNGLPFAIELICHVTYTKHHLNIWLGPQCYCYSNRKGKLWDQNSLHDYVTEITHILLVGRPHKCWYSFIRVAIWEISLNAHKPGTVS